MNVNTYYIFIFFVCQILIYYKFIVHTYIVAVMFKAATLCNQQLLYKLQNR